FSHVSKSGNFALAVICLAMRKTKQSTDHLVFFRIINEFAFLIKLFRPLTLDNEVGRNFNVAQSFVDIHSASYDTSSYTY
ncbi:hypothetical protein, partial [Acinetobacter sp. YH16031]|uniref:hypothetical protein n=1 Tax=Acinetobacter sp. YH16031 TaxID=2601180 RepID=UPI001C552A68